MKQDPTCSFVCVCVCARARVGASEHNPTLPRRSVLGLMRMSELRVDTRYEAYVSYIQTGCIYAPMEVTHTRTHTHKDTPPLSRSVKVTHTHTIIDIRQTTRLEDPPAETVVSQTTKVANGCRGWRPCCDWLTKYRGKKVFCQFCKCSVCECVRNQHVLPICDYSKKKKQKKRRWKKKRKAFSLFSRKLYFLGGIKAALLYSHLFSGHR